MTFDEKIRQVIDSFGSDCSFRSLIGDEYRQELDQALAAIHAAVLELIGDDEPVRESVDGWGKRHTSPVDAARNALRAELRQHLGEPNGN